MNRLLPALAALLALPTALAAQNGAHVVLQPGFVSGPGSVVTATGGIRYTYTPVPKVTAGQMPSMRSWVAVGTAGAAFPTRDLGEAAFTATGQLSYLFPHGTGFVALWGPAAIASYHPNGAGAGLRAELSYHVVGITAGALWADGQRGPRAVVLVDLPVFFLGDLASH
jgi:hypothetical protein